jgi:hypothetical protein
VTFPVTYSFANFKYIPVFLIIDHERLPKLDAGHYNVEYRMREYTVNLHSCLHIELLVEGTGRYNRFNVILCPFKIKGDCAYRNAIERLIRETHNPMTKLFGSLETQIILVDNHLFKIFRDENLPLEQLYAKAVTSNGFLCVLRTRLDLTASLYFQLQSELPELQESYRMNYCPFCYDST